MRKSLKIKVTALCLFLMLGSVTFLLAQKAKSPQKIIYLAGGRLIDGTGEKVIDNSLVIIEGEKILYAGQNKSLEKMPEGQIIDCSGKTILPGLFDAHIHLGGACTFGYIPLEDERKLSGFLYCGVTSIFDLGGIEDWIFNLREAEKKGEIKSPRIFAVGPLFTSPQGHGTEYGVPMALTPTTEEEAREAVKKLAPKKPDLVKIIYEKGSKKFTSLTFELMEVIIDEAHKNDLKIVTHITTLEQAKDAVKAGTDGLAHIVANKEVDEALLKDMKDKNVFCLPTLSVFEVFSGLSLSSQKFLEWPLVAKGVCQEIVEDLKEKSKLEMFTKNTFFKKERLSFAKINLKKMADSGIKLALGTDAGNPVVFFGSAVHRELELTVEAGLSPLEAITAATKNAADILEQDDKLGTLAQGKLADILIINENPLEDIKNTQDIFMVIKNGEILDREKLAEEINPPQKPLISTLNLPNLFDDFEDGFKKTNLETEWQILTDKVAGGSSTSNIEIIPGGANSSKYALHFFGKVTTKFAFGFAGAVASLGKEIGQNFDISQYAGIKFKVRGNGKTYKIVFSTASVKDYDDFFYTFSPSEDWKEIVVPFSKLRQFGFGKKVEWTAIDVQGLGFMTIGAPHERFDLYVDDISFFKDTKDKKIKRAPLETDLNQKLIQKIETAKSKLQTGFDTWNPEILKEARDSFLYLLLKSKEEKVYLLYYIALCNYRLNTYYLSSNNTEEAEMYNAEGQKYLEKAMEVEPSFGELYALYAILLGHEIALHQEKAMLLGLKIYEYFVKAFEKDPDNPRINLLKGMSDLYTPEAYGGGADNAIKTLEKSVTLFEKEDIKDPIKPSWGKEEAYTFLGIAYKQKKDYEKAREFLKKALEINPNFGLAAKELTEIENK